MLRRTIVPIVCMAIVLVGCSLAAPPARTTPVAVSPTHTPEDGAEPTPEPVIPGAVIGAQEAIMILEPGPRSRLLSPMRLAGMADPTHEQVLVVRVLGIDGEELVAPQPITIAAPLGERGSFETSIAFNVSQDVQAFVQVFTQSARDGCITHLASVAVTLSAGGPERIAAWSSHPEQISITAPLPGGTLFGGVAHINGVGIASFEGTFVIEILDADGVVVGFQPIINNAPDLGLPGMFSVDVPYSVSQPGPGRCRRARSEPGIWWRCPPGKRRDSSRTLSRCRVRSTGMPMDETGSQRFIAGGQRSRVVATLVLVPAVPMLLLSIASLGLFYLAPVRFGQLISRLPGESLIRTALVFAPATLFAIVVLATLYAVEKPVQGGAGTCPQRAVKSTGRLFSARQSMAAGSGRVGGDCFPGFVGAFLCLAGSLQLAAGPAAR